MVLVLMGATLISGLLGEYLDAITIVAIIVMNGGARICAGIPGGEFAAGAESSCRRRWPRFCAAGAVDDRSGQRACSRGYRPAGERGPDSGGYPCSSKRTAVMRKNPRLPANRFRSGSMRRRSWKRICRWAISSNIGFMGTMVTRGTAKGIVIRTGHGYGDGQNRRSDPTNGIAWKRRCSTGWSSWAKF